MSKQFEGHTPEPWKPVFKSNTHRAVRSKGYFICELNPPIRFIGQDDRYNKELKTYEADQNLISAAPTLLRQRNELLEALEEICNREDTPMHIWQIANNAMDKIKPDGEINNIKNEDQ